MLEELGNAVLGPWGVAALVLLGINGATGGAISRNAARGVVRGGRYVAERSGELVAEVKEEEARKKGGRGNGERTVEKTGGGRMRTTRITLREAPRQTKQTRGRGKKTSKRTRRAS